MSTKLAAPSSVRRRPKPRHNSSWTVYFTQSSKSTSLILSTSEMNLIESPVQAMSAWVVLRDIHLCADPGSSHDQFHA